MWVKDGAKMTGGYLEGPNAGWIRRAASITPSEFDSLLLSVCCLAVSVKLFLERVLVFQAIRPMSGTLCLER